MLPTALIAFREFLEAFLIVGVFLGISKKLGLKKETEITLAAIVGVVLSLLLTTLTYVFGDYARGALTEENADFLEGYLMVFSGLFLAYVVLSLHDMMNRSRGGKLIKAHKKLQENAFDISLFFTIVFLVMREGFEIALFTASVSLFSSFMQNLVGLLAGFAAASAIGLGTFFAYIRFPIHKVFKFTEYLIVLLGAALVQNGITEIFETHFDIDLADMMSFNWHFLPDHDTFIGHLLRGLFGIDSEMSLIRLGIMGIYIAVIYVLFMRQRHAAPAIKK